MLVVASGGEGDLRQRVIILRTGQRGVQHENITLENTEEHKHDNTYKTPL